MKDIGDMTAEETYDLFMDCVAYLEKDKLYVALTDVLTKDDKDELIIRWEEEEEKA